VGTLIPHKESWATAMEENRRKIERLNRSGERKITISVARAVTSILFAALLVLVVGDGWEK